MASPITGAAAVVAPDVLTLTYHWKLIGGSCWNWLRRPDLWV
jgi:hypothetical protein